MPNDPKQHIGRLRHTWADQFLQSCKRNKFSKLLLYVNRKNQKEALQKVKQLKEVREETDDVKWEPGTESQMWCAKVRTSSQGF